MVLFDTSEPLKYNPDSQESMPNSPTFSTGKKVYFKKQIKENSVQQIFNLMNDI